ncbi:hypothetical protein V8E36_003828 [Tilletia maclaganii]
MGLLNRLVTSIGRLVVYLQVLCFLPLSLDLGGRDCFLAYGASLASYYALLSTFRLVVKRTRLEPIGNFLAAFQVIVVPISLLVCFNVYSPPAESYFAEVKRSAAAAAASSASAGSAGGGGGGAGGGSISAGSAGVASGIGSAAAAVASRAAGKLAFGSANSGSAASSHSMPPPPAAPEDLSSFIEWLLAPPAGEEAQRFFAAAVSAFFWVAKRVPPSWSALLRFSSPIFSLLEAVSTLLLIQSVGGFSHSLIATSLKRPHASKKRAPTTLIGRIMPKPGMGLAELWQISFLLLAALTYVISAIILVLSFEGATRGRPGAAAAVGACVSSTLWLTAISFALQRGNVVETSLLAAYVVFNVVQLPDALAFTADPLALIRSFKYAAAGAAASAGKQNLAGTVLTLLGLTSSNAATSGAASSLTHTFDPARYLPRIVIETAEALFNTLGYALVQSIDFIAAAASALPASVIVSLVYRLVVLYAAIRILPRLKATANEHAAAARRTADADKRWAKANAAALSPGSSGRLAGVDLDAGSDDSVRSSPIYSRATPRNSGVRAPTSMTPLSSTGPGRPTSDGEKNTTSAATSSRSSAPVARLGLESEGVPEPFLDSDPAGVLDLGLGDETEAEGDGEPPLSLLGRRDSVEDHVLDGDGSSRSARTNGASVAGGGPNGTVGSAGDRRLRDEEPFGAFISIIISYSRLILIAVYSHLLLLDQSHQIYWRFLTIASCLLLWTFEILLGHEDQIYKLE